MESQYQKWVNITYLVASVLVGYVVFSLLNQGVGAYDLETKIRHVDLILRGFAVLVAVLLFAFLYRHESANQFMHEVLVELSRVHWPTPRATRAATWIVIVMVLISGLLLGLMDYVWLRFVQWIL